MILAVMDTMSCYDLEKSLFEFHGQQWYDNMNDKEVD